MDDCESRKSWNAQGGPSTIPERRVELLTRTFPGDVIVAVVPLQTHALDLQNGRDHTPATMD